MSLLDRLLGRTRPASGLRVRPESVRAVLVLTEADAPEPTGDGVEYVLRVFQARNPELGRAMMQRDLWPAVQIGRAAVPSDERDDPARLAARIERSHGAGLLGLLQDSNGPDGAPVVLLVVHGAAGDEPAEHHFRRTELALLPRLDLTDPAAERAR